MCSLFSFIFLRNSICVKQRLPVQCASIICNMCVCICYINFLFFHTLFNFYVLKMKTSFLLVLALLNLNIFSVFCEENIWTYMHFLFWLGIVEWKCGVISMHSCVHEHKQNPENIWKGNYFLTQNCTHIIFR